MITTLDIKWEKRNKTERLELFNLKNQECQRAFHSVTSETNILSSELDTEKDLDIATKHFIKRLDTCIHKCFRKIRTKEIRNPELEKLFEKRKYLRSQSDKKSIKELGEIEDKLADLCAENYNRLINEEINDIDCESGGVQSDRFWALKKRLFPKSRDPPTAMLDEFGNLVTCQETIENEALKVYQQRLKNRPMREDLKNLEHDKNELCKLRLKIAASRKTPDWTMTQLDVVLKSLKVNKSRDPHGYANELFKIDVAGDDLKRAILLLMNRIKNEQKFPKILEICNISSIWKKKKSRNDFENYRGIFRVSVFRSILDKLIYNA